MKIRLRRGRRTLIGWIAIGLTLSGLGLWWWDSKIYPLPEPVENWIVSKEATMGGYRGHLMVGLFRLRHWKRFRITKWHFPKANLEEGEWNYTVLVHGKPTSLPTPMTGAIIFRDDGKAVFDPRLPTPGIPGPRIVDFVRRDSGQIVFSWDDATAVVTLSAEELAGSKDCFFLKGGLDGREFRVWGLYGLLMHREPRPPVGSGDTPSPAGPPPPRH